MELDKQIQLIENSINRIKKMSGREKDESWRVFMRRETWLQLERVYELYQEVAEEKTQKAAPEILVRLHLRDLNDKVNLDEVRFDLDQAEVMIRGYRCVVETFRPESQGRESGANQLE